MKFTRYSLYIDEIKGIQKIGLTILYPIAMLYHSYRLRNDLKILTYED